MSQIPKNKLSNQDNCNCINNYYDKRPKLRLQSQTTNKAFYKPLPIQKPVQYQVPKVKQSHYDPQVLQTSYKSGYKKPPATSTNAFDNQTAKSSSGIIGEYMKRKKDIPFYSDTSYKDSYKPNAINYQKQPTYQYKPNDNKLQGQSSYKADFVAKKANSDSINSGQGILNAKQYMSRKPKIPFQGSSSYKQTFKAHELKPEKLPEYKYSKNPNKFQGQSSYKQTFKAPPKEALKSQFQHCPVHPSKMAMK